MLASIPAVTSNVLFLSFLHGVLDGPPVDVYLNDVLVWPNTPAGAILPYYPVAMQGLGKRIHIYIGKGIKKLM